MTLLPLSEMTARLTLLRRLLGLAAVLMVSNGASAATLTYPAPVPVPHGLLIYPNPIQGRHAFGPADGIDLVPGGKADWTAPAVAQTTVTRPRRAVLGYIQGREAHPPTRPGLPALPPLCCHRSTPPLPHDPEPPVTPVPLPAGVWMLLAGLMMLTAVNFWRGPVTLRNVPKGRMSRNA